MKKTVIISIITGVTLMLVSFLSPLVIMLFSPSDASVGIIGGADGPTTVFLYSDLFYGFTSYFVLLGILVIIIGLGMTIYNTVAQKLRAKIAKADCAENFREFEQKEAEREQAGRVIIWIVGITNIAVSILNIITGMNIFAVIINIALSVALLCGVDFARTILGFLLCTNAIFSLFSLAAADDILYKIYIVLVFVYLLAAGLTLLISRSVREAMYRQRNG